MSKEEELQQQLKDAQATLVKEPEKKPDSKVGKVLRIAIITVFLCLLIGVVVMGFLKR